MGATVSNSTTVTSTATEIISTATLERLQITLYNNGSEDVFLGPSTVTASTGLPLEAGERLVVDLSDTPAKSVNSFSLYGITKANTVDVRSWTVYL